MRLSEAIRLGALLKPQAYNALRSKGKSCVLGAACDAVGVQQSNESSFSLHRLFTEFQFLHQKAPNCPACSFLTGWRRRRCNEEYDVEDVLIHLNDDHLWTRERIADWVETFEPADDRCVQPEAVAVDPVLSRSHGTSTREKKNY